MRKRIRQGLAGCLIAALLLAAVPAGSVQAGTLEDSIKEKQEAISQAEQEKKKLQSSISNIKAMVKDLEKSKKRSGNLCKGAGRQAGGHRGKD